VWLLGRGGWSLEKRCLSPSFSILRPWKPSYSGKSLLEKGFEWIGRAFSLTVGWPHFYNPHLVFCAVCLFCGDRLWRWRFGPRRDAWVIVRAAKPARFLDALLPVFLKRTPRVVESNWRM
jgi:hypothetical protein